MPEQVASIDFCNSVRTTIGHGISMCSSHVSTYMTVSACRGLERALDALEADRAASKQMTPRRTSSEKEVRSLWLLPSLPE